MSLIETKCPECDGPMISRNGKYGTFWGCKNYPKCLGTRDSMGRSKEERDKWKEENNKDKDDKVRRYE